MSTLEQEIQTKGLTAPRVTPAMIEAAIESEHYVTGDRAFPPDPVLINGVWHDSERTKPLKLLTLCVLILRNGFTVVGTSAPASAENFDAELGRKIARSKAVEQLWPLLGYCLREQLSHDQH